MRAQPRRKLGIACFAAVAALLGSTGNAAVLDANFVQSTLPDMFLPITAMAWATDGSDRLFLTLKDGTTRIVENGVLLPSPFMTVTEIYTGSECGLLGIAFDPNFVENGYVYFFVTVSASEQRIVRYRAVGNVGVEPTVIVSGLPTRGINHDGGALGFGPDGKLYWAIGDLGTGAGVDADLASLASKVGRANRDGSVPTDNPFYDGDGANEDRIWARGFRNPFTLAFRPATGDLWLNVVGTNLEQVFVVGAGDHGGWSLHEYWQPEGFLEPVISYYTNGSAVHAFEPVGGAVRSGGVATFRTTTRHWVHPGEQLTISGVTDASFDGVYFVTGVPSTTTFTVEQAGLDATSGSGSATTPHIGGCITGGVFDDSTAGTAAYRGNFYFGDRNTGYVMRARLTGDVIDSVEKFADGLPWAVDMSQGPDGDLWAATHSERGPVRYRFRATSQHLVVSKTNVWMLEDGSAAFNVRLSTEPTDTLAARVRPVARTNLSVTSGADLTFSPSDWSVPQVVTLSSARDDDTVDEVLELSVAAPGLPSETVRVRIIDEYAPEPPAGGGAGGDAGAMGGGEGGVDAVAGEGGDAGSGVSGATTRGGTAGSGATGGGETNGGAAGEPGGGGEGGNDETGGDESTSDAGCGCATGRRSSGGVVLALSILALLRRRAMRRSTPR